MHILSNLACLEITGDDRKFYLQGQLSNDLMQLSPARGQLTCCSSAQGRVQFVLRLVERADSLLMILPAAMRDPALQRLRRYLLRARVRIEAPALHVHAACRTTLAQAALPVPEAMLEHALHGACSVLRWNDPLEERWLVISPENHAASSSVTVNESTDLAWSAADIRAGLPQVLPPTHESFVAQMLNLDALGGISFNKGCYTGQEIIARARYRGTVKRRMFRYSAPCPVPAPGTRVLHQGEHAGDVVNAVATETGTELLAVISLASVDQPLSLESHPGVMLNRQPLPYTVHTT